MIEICDDADKISHAAPLANFSDMLAEKYLWPQSDENDEERWEEYFYDDKLFYSLYFYSRAVLDATGVDFAQFKPGPGGVLSVLLVSALFKFRLQNIFKIL